MRLRSVVLSSVLAGCGGASPYAEAPDPTARVVATPASAPAPLPASTASTWPEATRSPWRAAPLDERSAALTAACGVPDGALARVAAKLAGERARGRGAPDPDRIALLLRAHGEPHVRPRILSASGRGAVDDDAVRARLETDRRPNTRCGLAFARPDVGRDGNELLVVVAAEALADLEPLPARARTGEWLTFTAALHVPATNAKLVVLGPRGLPRTVPTSIDRTTGNVRARFALDRPGAFTVQLVGDLASGPQPLLEARVFADVEPSDDETPSPAPGEDAAASNDATALGRMIAALRSSESLPPLARDERLDALALAHAQKMKLARAVAHDLGDGDLALRFETAGLSAKVVGENVARARSVALAHRALHASPSHRMNLLRTDLTHVGLGVATSDDGDVYVCEVFASGLR